MIETVPLPEMSEGMEAPFWEALKQGHLAVQHCASCDLWMFPTRVRCAACGGRPAWRRVSGRGRIWSFTRIHPPVLPAFAPFTPYPVILVELAEQRGVRIVGNLIDRADDRIDAVPPERIAIDAPVELVIRDLGGVPWPAWRLANHA